MVPRYPTSDYPGTGLYDQPGYPSPATNTVQDFQVTTRHISALVLSM